MLAGLGRDLHRTGKLHVEGAERAFTALQRFKYIADGHGLINILIAATAALRDASDAPEFIEKIRDEIGYEIKPMSGEREAYISSLGVLAGDQRAHGQAADLGGASLELTNIGFEERENGSTYPLGPFSVYEGEFDAALLEPKIQSALNDVTFEKFEPGQPLFLIGGAWRNLGLIHQKRTGYPLRIINNYQLGYQGSSRSWGLG